MKTSKYNYVVPNGENVIFFNGLSESFFEIPKSRETIYSRIIQNPDQYEGQFDNFLDKMVSKGFVINDETDEQQLIEEKFMQVRKEEEYHIMVLPTYQCNLRCWYCIQDHSNIIMSDRIINKVKDLIANQIKREEIKRVRLSWFGGEPLLAYNVILELTRSAKQLSEDAGKEFYSEITTNGTLLNRKRIESLKDVGIGCYQITIDGDKTTHDSIKVLAKGSAFVKTLENINIIAESTPCILRFNYTHENLKPQSITEDLKQRIRKENRKNVTFMLYKVWQESQEDIKETEVNKLVNLSTEIGLRAMQPTCNLCYADQKHFHCVFPNGKVGKCDNTHPLKAKGEIEAGEVIWNDNVDTHIPAYLNTSYPCRECYYLPICWGPCVAKRQTMTVDGKTGHCWYLDKDSEMERFVRNRCENYKQYKLT